MKELFDHPAARRIAIACVAAVLFSGVVAVATQTGDSGGVGDARLTTRGRAAVTSVSGTRREVTGTVALHRGETVEAIVEAMTIELPDGSTVEGRPAFKAADATRVKIMQPVELLAGELLVTSSSPTAIDAGGNRVKVDPVEGASAMRVSRSLAVAAGVYRGGGTFDSAGQTRAIPALRTIEVSALGRPPSAPDPLQVSDDDPWDRRFLGAAMDLGRTLDQYSAGYTATLGANPRTPGFYRSIVPSLAEQPELTAELLNESPHPAGETIVGGAIAALSRRSTFAEQWRSAFAFRDAGAAWGLVALDQGVAADPLLSEVQDALNQSELAFVEAARNPQPAGSAPTTTAGGGATTTTTGSGGGPTTAPPDEPEPPTTTVIPPTGSPVVDGLVKNVNDLLDGLIGGAPPGG